MATVSIVIPCHNYGRFLGEAIESVEGQSRVPDEVIVCDDGSTDDTWEVARELLSDRPEIDLYRHIEAWGLVATLNEMIIRTSCDIVIPLSSDDRMGPRYIEKTAGAIETRGLDFAYTDLRCFGSEDTYFEAPEMDAELLTRRNFISGSAAMRRSLFVSLGGYSTAFGTLGFEDYDFWISAVESGARGGKAYGTYLEWRRHPDGSRNTATIGGRVLLRWLLLRRHARFLLHPRTVRSWTRRPP